jgi:hypothetical protein
VGLAQLHAVPSTVPDVGGSKANVIGLPPADRSNQNEPPGAKKFTSGERETEKSSVPVVSPVTVTVPNGVGQTVPAQAPVLIPSRLRLKRRSTVAAWPGLERATAPAIAPAAAKRDKIENEEAFITSSPASTSL